MMSAAAMGATAFQKGLGAIHALSHPVGAVHHTHHGTTNAVFMPTVLQFNADAISSRFDRAASYLGIDGGFDGFCTFVDDFNQSFEIPRTLSELGVTDPDFDTLTEAALRDSKRQWKPCCTDRRRGARALCCGDITRVARMEMNTCPLARSVPAPRTAARSPKAALSGHLAPSKGQMATTSCSFNGSVPVLSSFAARNKRCCEARLSLFHFFRRVGAEDHNIAFRTAYKPRPTLHEHPPSVQQITPSIGPFYIGPDLVGQAQFRDLARRAPQPRMPSRGRSSGSRGPSRLPLPCGARASASTCSTGAGDAFGPQKQPRTAAPATVPV